MPILQDQMRISGSSRCLLAMKKDSLPEAERILNLTLEIIFLLTGEDFVLTRRQSDCVSEGSLQSQSPLTDPPNQPPAEEEEEEEEGGECRAALDSSKAPCRAAEEVQVKCEDIAVYLSLEEWQYMEGHREHYMDVVKETSQPSITAGECRDEALTDSCGSALYSPICMEAEDRPVTQNDQVESGGGIIRCKEEEVEPDVMATDDHGVRNPAANSSSSGVSWPQDCAEGEDRTITQDYQEEAIDEVIQCKEEEEDEADDLPADLHRSQIDHHGRYCPFPPHPDSGVTAANTQITSDCPERGEMKSNAPAAEKPQATDSPEQHTRVGCAPNPASIGCAPNPARVGCTPNPTMNSPKSSAGAPKMREGVSETFYKCRYCRLSFSSKPALLTHEKTHSSVPLHRCAECLQGFPDNAALAAHQWMSHRHRPAPEGKPFSCEECGRSFTKKSSLVKHQRLHTGAFSCPDCGKCLSDKTGLILHRRTHTGEKPFACSECGKRFTQMCHLVTHQSVHTGARPFTCGDCGKCFSIRSVLAAHQAVHHRHKTWPCPECGKGFTQRSALVTHQRVHKKAAPTS